jgi:hypothetical protein
MKKIALLALLCLAGCYHKETTIEKYDKDWRQINVAGTSRTYLIQDIKIDGEDYILMITEESAAHFSLCPKVKR